MRHLYVTNATHGEVGNGLDAEGFAFKVINKGRGAVEKWLYLHVESVKTNGDVSSIGVSQIILIIHNKDIEIIKDKNIVYIVSWTYHIVSLIKDN